MEVKDSTLELLLTFSSEILESKLTEKMNGI